MGLAPCRRSLLAPREPRPIRQKSSAALAAAAGASMNRLRSEVRDKPRQDREALPHWLVHHRSSEHPAFRLVGSVPECGRGLEAEGCQGGSTAPVAEADQDLSSKPNDPEMGG